VIAHQGYDNLAAFEQEHHTERATRPEFVSLVAQFTEPQSCMLVRVPESQRKLRQPPGNRSFIFIRELFVRGYERLF